MWTCTGFVLPPPHTHMYANSYTCTCTHIHTHTRTHTHTHMYAHNDSLSQLVSVETRLVTITSFYSLVLTTRKFTYYSDSHVCWVLSSHNFCIYTHQVGCRFWDLALKEHAQYNKVGFYNTTSFSSYIAFLMKFSLSL